MVVTRVWTSTAVKQRACPSVVRVADVDVLSCKRLFDLIILKITFAFKYRPATQPTHQISNEGANLNAKVIVI